jgi:predicted Zn finger-like uncharacterized protein
MVEPLSITCPHCTSSFKVKSTTAIGKKVKCPKCAEPFVIARPSTEKPAQPKKKRPPVKPEADFFADDSDSPTDLFEDDFDSWDDDLSGGPAAKPAAKKTKAPPNIKKTSSSFSLKQYGLSPFITGTFVCLVLLNLILFLMQSHFLTLAFFLTCIVGVGCLFAGGLGLLIEAAKENGTELILCLIVPLYNVYFAISRFEQTKHSLATFATGVFLILISFTLTFGSAIGFLSNRHRNLAHNPPPVHTAPDFNQPPHTNSTPSINQSRPSGSNPQRAPENTTETVPESSFVTGLARIAKFDLSEIKPMLMTWPAEGATGDNVYRQEKTDSIAKVYDAQNSRSFAGETPAGVNMKFRVYLPPDIDPASPVPCVLVPPAGSNLLTGMAIDPPDLIPNPEHEPYVKAGFAVVTFSLDGDMPNREQSTILEFRSAHEDFRKSKAGLVNCVHAFLETQAVIPGIDKNNVFIAGHSSAGTLSLLFAEHYPQIKGCLAYAPSVDLKKSMAPYLPDFKSMIPDVEEFIRLSSPQTHIRSLTCPVFIFHSRGDQVTSFANSQRFASQLKSQGTEVEYVAGNGSDHYQTMIDEGLPKGIEWLKKQVTKPNKSQSDPQMAAASPSTTENKGAMQATPQPAKKQIDVTRRKATFKVTGFDKFHENNLKSSNQSSADFWKKSLVHNIQLGLKEIVPEYDQRSIYLDVDKMTLSFEYTGALPAEIPQKFAAHFFAKSIILADQAPSIQEVSSDPNSRIMDSNFLTFRITTLNRLRFNKDTSPQIAETLLKQIDRYVPDSLVINYDGKWAYIRLKGLGDHSEVERAAINAFSTAGIFVRAEKIDLSPADLAANGDSNLANSASGTMSATTDPPSDTKQKYIIHYGVYGGDDVKDSVKRSLKGFVWVDQASIQFNPDAKEISFINRSAVDSGALDRALTRNKFYQLNITREALPEEKPEPEKTEAKVGTE